MALARCCDRCGSFYKPLEFNKSEKYDKGRPVIKLTIYTFGIEKDLDLCEKCGKELRQFLGEDITCMK